MTFLLVEQRPVVRTLKRKKSIIIFMSVSENFPYISQTVKVDETVLIIGEVYVGEHCSLGESVVLEAKFGRLVLGDKVQIGSSSRVWSNRTRTKIGDHTTIGQNCDISCDIGHHCTIENNVTLHASVEIGSNCQIEADQELKEMTIPDNSTVRAGKILD